MLQALWTLAAAAAAAVTASPPHHVQPQGGGDAIRCFNRVTNSSGVCLPQCDCPWANIYERELNADQLFASCPAWTIDIEVCCPEKPLDVPQLPTGYRTAEKMCRLYSRQYRFCCADRVKPLIINGRPASPREYPHMALIGYGEDRPTTSDYSCGGSLISPQFVLTAAHCVTDQRRRQANWVLLGALNLSNIEVDSRPQLLRVVDRIPHEKFSRHLNSDIALLKLERAAEMNSYVYPACLFLDDTAPARAEASGWGYTGDNRTLSSVLMTADLPVHEQVKCKAAWRYIAPIDDQSQICAGNVTANISTCQGDSGGPLQVLTEDETHPCMYHIVGITSFGYGNKFCGSKSAVYTKVSHFLSWIESRVWPEEEHVHTP